MSTIPSCLELNVLCVVYIVLCCFSMHCCDILFNFPFCSNLMRDV